MDIIYASGFAFLRNLGGGLVEFENKFTGLRRGPGRSIDMWHMGTDRYECDFCGVEIQWESSDDLHGGIWECEECGEHFCEKCFTDRWGVAAWDTMLHEGLIGSFETSKIMCPECYGEFLRDYPAKE